MGKRSQNIIIGAMAFAMLFSSVGTGLLLLAQDDSTPTSTISQQLAEQQELLEQQQAEQPPVDPATIPEAFIPDGDVTVLEAVDLEEGTGAAVEPTSTLTVNYHGTLATDGTVFDSSFERGQPATFPLTGVIDGWQEGLVGMKEGGTRRLVIPSEQAYGEAGSGAVIGPNADLVFVVELISIDN